MFPREMYVDAIMEKASHHAKMADYYRTRGNVELIMSEDNRRLSIREHQDRVAYLVNLANKIE